MAFNRTHIEQLLPASIQFKKDAEEYAGTEEVEEKIKAWIEQLTHDWAKFTPEENIELEEVVAHHLDVMGEQYEAGILSMEHYALTTNVAIIAGMRMRGYDI